jgi:hypothetical protein
MKRDLTAEEYEVIIRRLIFSNWVVVTQEGKDPKARFTIQFGPTHYSWEGCALSAKVSEPLDWLFARIMGGMPSESK